MSVIKVVDILTAIKYFSFSRCPIRAVSTKPTKGIARFEKKIGTDNLKICHFVTFEDSLKLSMSMDKLFFIMKQLNYIRNQ